jgi:hypothetical protein
MIKALTDAALADERNRLMQKYIDAALKQEPQARIIKMRLQTVEREIAWRHSRKWKQ